MNAIIYLDGVDVTASCRLQDTRINYDSSRRLATAAITVIGRTPGTEGARYDVARYDEDAYSVSVGELPLCTILDGRDGVTKLFEGQAYSISLEQSDAAGTEVLYRLELNDYAAWLDRSVCWGGYTLTLPTSDAGIIRGLVGYFCPRINSALDVAEIVPVIQAYDWKNKTTRQVLDDMAALAGAEWRVDFNAVLHYGLAADAPDAPFALSTSPDYSTSFPVNVNNYRRDFSNPVNRCYVRGAALPDDAGFIEASYADPVSVEKYGELQSTIVDDQITNGWDAALRAKSVVLKYAYPVESGGFTVWARDGLAVGQQVALTEDALGIDGWYVIRSLTMQWVSQNEVEYQAQFGASQPDLETLLRVIDQRTRWKSTVLPPAQGGGGGSTGPPPDGSVTDASIAPGGLHAQSIATVNANTIQGYIQAGQIQSVNAGAIQGVITAEHIGGVNAASIVGAIQAYQIGGVYSGKIEGAIIAGQIGSVNATTIQGVVVSSQLADQIIDNLAKYATALTPIQIVKIGDPWGPVGGMPNKNFPANSYFYYEPNGRFYRVTPDGLTWTDQGANPDALSGSMSFYHIGRLSAQNIVGLIVAAQIGSITAGQITGQVQAGQIGGVNASVIAGQIHAGQISSVNAVAIQGVITSTQIQSIAADKITGTIAAGQIGTIAAGQITGTLAYNQIGSINAATITIGLVGDSQISGIHGGKITAATMTSDAINTYAFDVGSGQAAVGKNMPARIRIFDSSANIIGQIGYLGEQGSALYGGWFRALGAGGNSWADARVYTDGGGNLFLRNVDLNISNQILTSVTTLDATYSTLALRNVSGTDSASFISRGLVVYGGGVKVGYIGKAAGGSWLECEFTIGGGYVLINGKDGVRSDLGYKVGSVYVINSAGQFTGTVTGTISGTVTGSVNTTGTVNAGSGFTGGAFSGSSVNTAGSCKASGFNTGIYTGQTYNIAFRDSGGGMCTLWIGGVNQGAVQLQVVGGVVVGKT